MAQDMDANLSASRDRNRERFFDCKLLSPKNITIASIWVLPEDLSKKDPCNFNTEMLVSNVGKPCPTLGQLLASRILYALLVGEKQQEIARAKFGTQNFLKVSQLVVNSR